MFNWRKPKDEPLVCTKFVKGEFSDDGHSFLVLKCIKEHEDPSKARYRIHRYGTVLDAKTDSFDIKDFGVEIPSISLNKAVDYMAAWEDQQSRKGKRLDDNIGLLKAVNFNDMNNSQQNPLNSRIAALQTIGNEIKNTAEWTFKETSNLTGGPNLRATMPDRGSAYELQAQIAAHGVQAEVGRKGDGYILIVPEHEFKNLDAFAAKQGKAMPRKPGMPAQR